MYFSEFSKIHQRQTIWNSCYHLKGDSEYFKKKKNQRCPKSTHKLPISPFSKYHKNRTISPFSPIIFFFETMHGIKWLKQIFLNDKCIWLACMSNFSYGNCYKSYRHSINLGIHKLWRLWTAVIIQSLILSLGLNIYVYTLILEY